MENPVLIYSKNVWRRKKDFFYKKKIRERINDMWDLITYTIVDGLNATYKRYLREQW